MSLNLLQVDWSTIPAPVDDGAATHLKGVSLPSIGLRSTGDGLVDLSRLSGRIILYIYPRTGRPGVALPDGWDMIPGARGCTPQSCAFRDHFVDLQRLGVDHVFGMSAQTTVDQSEAVERLHLPFALLSDNELAFASRLKLPTFEASGMTLLKRLTLVIERARITKVFYPVFPPDRSASEVLEWLQERSD